MILRMTIMMVVFRFYKHNLLRGYFQPSKALYFSPFVFRKKIEQSNLLANSCVCSDMNYK